MLPALRILGLLNLKCVFSFSSRVQQGWGTLGLRNTVRNYCLPHSRISVEGLCSLYLKFIISVGTCTMLERCFSFHVKQIFLQPKLPTPPPLFLFYHGRAALSAAMATNSAHNQHYLKNDRVFLLHLLTLSDFHYKPLLSTRMLCQ